MKHGLLTILLLLSLAGRAQIEVDAYRNLLIGGAEAPEMEDMSETDTYVPRIFINNRDVKANGKLSIPEGGKIQLRKNSARPFHSIRNMDLGRSKIYLSE